VGTIVKSIPICDEDIMNLKSAIKKLLPISEPFQDLEIFTLQGIIEAWEGKPYVIHGD